MIRLRHVKHPVRSGKGLLARVRARLCSTRLRLYRYFAMRPFRKIKRGRRDLCWCGGRLLPFKWHSSYGICDSCGCYVNMRPPAQESLEQLYSLGLYWVTQQRLKGYPTIGERAALYVSDGRVDQWLKFIRDYGPPTGCALEVGCAPGVLLEELRKRGYECVGVEISHSVADWTRRTTALDVRSGFFPGVDVPSCDLFLAFDVLEHSPCPVEFMREAHNRLRPGGIAIIQTGIDRYDYEPPFGQRFDIFDDLEHLFLFTDKSMAELASRVGLEIISNKERIWLAGEVCIFTKPEGGF